MADADHFWDELQRAAADPNFTPNKTGSFERAPSERRSQRLQKKPSKARPSAESEERR